MFPTVAPEPVYKAAKLKNWKILGMKLGIFIS